jgi:hypothetical protein
MKFINKTKLSHNTWRIYAEMNGSYKTYILTYKKPNGVAQQSQNKSLSVVAHNNISTNSPVRSNTERNAIANKNNTVKTKLKQTSSFSNDINNNTEEKISFPTNKDVTTNTNEIKSSGNRKGNTKRKWKKRSPVAILAEKATKLPQSNLSLNYIFGRGGKCNERRQQSQCLQLMKRHAKTYNSLPMAEKKKFVKIHVYNEMISMGGKFLILQSHEGEDRLIECQMDDAIMKLMQTMRDMKKRPEMKNNSDVK